MGGARRYRLRRAGGAGASLVLVPCRAAPRRARLCDFDVGGKVRAQRHALCKPGGGRALGDEASLCAQGSTGRRRPSHPIPPTHPWCLLPAAPAGRPPAAACASRLASPAACSGGRVSCSVGQLGPRLQPAAGVARRPPQVTAPRPAPKAQGRPDSAASLGFNRGGAAVLRGRGSQAARRTSPGRPSWPLHKPPRTRGGGPAHLPLPRSKSGPLGTAAEPAVATLHDPRAGPMCAMKRCSALEAGGGGLLPQNPKRHAVAGRSP